MSVYPLITIFGATYATIFANFASYTASTTRTRKLIDEVARFPLPLPWQNE
ncbi:MAG: hypothetical protein H0W88_06230 [Parachlamydiaceae bacterium]|nr:hypothetical protein [Parachlamydiaceae bacterium]